MTSLVLNNWALIVRMNECGKSEHKLPYKSYLMLQGLAVNQEGVYLESKE